MSEVTRLIVNLNQETTEALRKLMADKGVTATETIRRAISLYSYFDTEVFEGRRIQVVGPGNDRREVVML